jgi:hypothetical protein
VSQRAEPPPPKLFTVDEANELVAMLTPVMREIQRLSSEAHEHQDRLQVLDVLWGEKVLEPDNPDHEELRAHRAALAEAADRVEAWVKEEILARGIRFPVGGLEHGLLDFPTLLDGRVVFLCWRLGEPSIQYWHEVHGGFAGRQPVTPDLARRMGPEED